MSITHAEKRAWILRIRDVKETDKGWYMCQINTDPMKSQVGYLDVVGEQKQKQKFPNTKYRFMLATGISCIVNDSNFSEHRFMTIAIYQLPFPAFQQNPQKCEKNGRLFFIDIEIPLNCLNFRKSASVAEQINCFLYKQSLSINTNLIRNQNKKRGERRDVLIFRTGNRKLTK